jgi:hypothetical protein
MPTSATLSVKTLQQAIIFYSRVPHPFAAFAKGWDSIHYLTRFGPRDKCQGMT